MSTPITAEDTQALEPLCRRLGVDPDTFKPIHRGFVFGVLLLVGHGYDLQAREDELTAWPSDDSKPLTAADQERLADWEWYIETRGDVIGYVSIFPRDNPDALAPLPR